VVLAPAGPPARALPPSGRRATLPRFHGHRRALLRPLVPSTVGPRCRARPRGLRRARRLERRAVHVLRRRRRRALPPRAALQLVVPRPGPSPRPEARAGQEAPARPLRTRGLLVRSRAARRALLDLR